MRVSSEWKNLTLVSARHRIVNLAQNWCNLIGVDQPCCYPELVSAGFSGDN
jgi:hypothetical protein